MTEFKENKWKNIFVNLDKKFLHYLDEIDFIKISLATKFMNFGSLPAGVLLITKGKMREICLDNKNEPFTINIYKEGDFVGSDHLLRGENAVSIIASSNVEGYILKADKFLNLIVESKEFLNSFSNYNFQEVFHSLKRNNKFKDLDFLEFKSFINIKQSTNGKTSNIFAGTDLSKKKKTKFIVSSCNLIEQKIGEIIDPPLDIKTTGKLPARLIPLTFPLPTNTQTESIKKRSEEYSKNNKLQVEALQDLYGEKTESSVYPDCRGKGQVEELLACVRMLCRFYELPFKKDFLKRILVNQFENSKITVNQIGALLDLIGLSSVILTPENNDQLTRIPTPSIFLTRGKPIIIWEKINNEFLIGDPKTGQSLKSTDQISNLLGKKYLLLSINKTNKSPKARFGLSWFWPSIKKHKSSLIQVIIASFFVQLLALLNPLLIQQIIDAVISQGNFSSLNILGGLLIFLAFAQALLGSLRTYLFSDTTNRIDVNLGSTIIRHLLRLPLDYFARRPVGEVSGRIGELENIRSFLTGTALTVLLDSIFSIIYIAVLLSYSVQLTIWALGVLPIFVALTIFISPILRDQLRRKAEATAKVNSHLVESLSGMETIKAQNMELTSEWKWEKMYSMQVKEGFRNTVTNTAASSASNFLQQVSGLIIIWVGAALVLQGKLTLGQLIAFRIISGYVTSPLLRLASLWQNFQETSISLERLSDIVDHPEEIEITGENLPPIPPIEGNIKYENVNFRFRSSGPYQLLNVSLTIKKSSFIGIVGSSGSGKSTVLKLLTRLYNPVSGSIKIDGHDISKVDLYSLRNQIGIVPQDSILFEGSIQNNIALTKPDASYQEIIDAAKIACADEFIDKLPSGYASMVGERGTGLSGGQRQRLAIARIILMKPKLLILDEATSALDVDTEKRLLKNILDFFKESTILFISHRLSNLKNADNIFVMSEGSLVEEGNHKSLVKLNGRYATLYKQQEIDN